MRVITLAILIGAAFVAAPSAIGAAAPKTKTSKPATTKKKSVKKVRPARQMQPTPDRYRQIQQALIEKGFLEGEATGQWDDRSVTALKKFEESQNLKIDGKLDSMSLIALGLGPKRVAQSTP